MNRGTKWWSEHILARKLKDRLQYVKHRADKLDAAKRWRENNLERCKENDRLRNKRMRPRKTLTGKLWSKKAYRTNENFKVSVLTRSRVLHALKRGVRKSRTTELIGCPLPVLRQWIESQFTDGMTWLNHGSFWEIDHVIPCCRFDLSRPEERRRCFHFSNHQPLTLEEHAAKSGKERRIK